MSWTDVYCEENPDHSDTYIECLVCEISRLAEENRKLGAQVARLQHSTGACEQIRKDQMIEDLVEENQILRSKLDWVREMAKELVDELV